MHTLLWSRLPRMLLCLLLGHAMPLTAAESVDGVAEESPQSSQRRGERNSLVFRDRITPHWFNGESRFWYRNDLREGAKEFVLIDAKAGTRELAFDHDRLLRALREAAGNDYRRLPFDAIEFIDDNTAIRFTVDDTTWNCDLSSYECSKTERDPVATEQESEAEPGRPRGRGARRGAAAERSPDGRWTAFVREHNVYARTANDEEVQLSHDGEDGLAYGRLSWSPDSTTLVGFRIEPGEGKEVHLVESSPRAGGRATLRSRPYALPGDKLTTYELNLFNIDTRRHQKPDVDRFEHGWLSPRLHWHDQNRRFAYEQTDRGHQRFRLLDVEASSGAVRNLVDERTETFIWTAHTENVRLERVTWLEEADEFIYATESNGWRHLYLIDAQTGFLKNPITQGRWVVRGIDRVDEATRRLWFHASGMNPDQDPYFVHFYSVNLDGSDLVALTEGNGNHSVQYSPDRGYLIDTYSRVDSAPIHELRRAADGRLVCLLEKADIQDLEAEGWAPPEVFVAKGRDGVTDIWGIINRPRDFDPNRKYPIIEDIYAGPQGSFVPKSFSARGRYTSLTDLGFIVVKIDGMGTANRSKAFHDVCWKKLHDAGFEDRILWMKAAAREYSYLDLDRVGVYGNSAGGQNAAAAVLFHPEFYKAAVASCGCHDNRMDKASWNEQWMGYPVGPQYVESSNIENAYRLQGKLFLIVGELDTNVPPESTLRFVDALIKADKDFDLLVIPGGGHGMGGAYGQRRMEDFFVRHLQPGLGDAPHPSALQTSN